MGRFVFRLQKVLDHRARVEDEKKRAFVKSRIAYIRENEKLGGLKRELEICNSKPVENFSGPLQYLVRFHYILLLEERIEDQTTLVKVREEDMNLKKAEFGISQKDRKVIDKLKENAKREHDIFTDLLEQKQNDEFALYGYVRR